MRSPCGIVPGVPSVPAVAGLRERFRGWFQREPKPVVPRIILIVDANAGNRGATSKLVESLGYQARQTASLRDALHLLDSEEPDFVLLAFDVEDATGLEALGEIHKIDPEVPVIMLASNAWDTRVADAMRQGAIAYLPRPFGAEDLRELFGRR